MGYADIIRAIHNNGEEIKVLEYLFGWLIRYHKYTYAINADISATIKLIEKLVNSSQTDKIVRQTIKDIFEE